MKQKTRMILLGVYDLFLSAGAIYDGVLMINSNYGIFAEYPKEWLTKVPFDSWVAPGIIAIAVFGLGNLLSAILCLIKRSSKPWLMSAIMGGVFYISLVAQVIILGEWFMATYQFFILSFIQLCLCGYAFWGYRKTQ